MPASDLLHVRLLGDLSVHRGAARVSLPASRRTRALLGYLIATGQPHSRAALCDLLWDGPDDPRASLRWSLAKLRPVVDDPSVPRLVADRERVRFEPLQCEIDVERVRRLVGEDPGAAPIAALEEAAALLRGEFLDGLELPGCYRFHHWCMALREAFGKTRRAVLQALIDRLSAEPERALPHAHAMVTADPLAEAAHAALVRLTAACGRYPDAERHYEWARDLLRREVALSSGGPLDDAIRRARREQQTPQREPDPQDRPTSSVPAGGAESPARPAARIASAPAPAAPSALLVGRDAEHALIVETLAGDAGGSLLLFTGEPGIGKTRVLDHLAELATAGGSRVLRGRCFEAEMARPYGPWLDALRGVRLEALSAADVAQAAPLVDGRFPEDGDRHRLYQGTLALLGALAGQQSLVLAFDDLQWIDEASASLLHYVARAPDGAASLRLCGAARSGELDDNPRARKLLNSLEREGLLRRHALSPLGVDDARRLLGSDGIDAAQALRQSGGNPLYLVELARATRRGSTARGRSIDRLIEERLDAMDATARELLGWASAMGGPLHADLLARASGLPAAEVLSRLERFEQHALLRAAGPSRMEFAHDLVRQVVYRGLSQPRREAIHRQFVRALAQDGQVQAGLHAELVHHALLANDALGVAQACLAAGQHCLRIFANGDASDAADRGLASVDELVPGPERTRLEIGLLGVRVAAAAGSGGRKLPALADRIERAIDAAQALGLHADAGEGWQIHAFWQQHASDTERTHRSTLEAERLTRRADAATHCRQLANTARCLLEIEADPVRGRELLAEATALAAELGLQSMEIEWAQALVHRADGRLDRACDALSRAVTLARLTAVRWREAECLTWLATVELEAGRLVDVQRHVGELVELAARMGETQVPFAQALGALAGWRANDRAAPAVIEQCLQQLRELDDKAHLAYVLNEVAALVATAGRCDAATACAQEALAAARAVRRPTEVAVALAALARSAADPASANDWLAQATSCARSARAHAAIAAATQAITTPAPTQRP